MDSNTDNFQVNLQRPSYYRGLRQIKYKIRESCENRSQWEIRIFLRYRVHVYYFVFIYSNQIAYNAAYVSCSWHDYHYSFNPIGVCVYEKLLALSIIINLKLTLHLSQN